MAEYNFGDVFIQSMASQLARDDAERARQEELAFRRERAAAEDRFQAAQIDIQKEAQGMQADRDAAAIREMAAQAKLRGLNLALENRKANEDRRLKKAAMWEESEFRKTSLGQAETFNLRNAALNLIHVTPQMEAALGEGLGQTGAEWERALRGDIYDTAAEGERYITGPELNYLNMFMQNKRLLAPKIEEASGNIVASGINRALSAIPEGMSPAEIAQTPDPRNTAEGYRSRQAMLNMTRESLLGASRTVSQVAAGVKAIQAGDPKGYEALGLNPAVMLEKNAVNQDAVVEALKSLEDRYSTALAKFGIANFESGERTEVLQAVQQLSYLRKSLEDTGMRLKYQQAIDMINQRGQVNADVLQLKASLARGQ